MHDFDYYNDYFFYCIAKPNSEGIKMTYDIYTEGIQVFYGRMLDAEKRRDEIRRKSKRNDYEIFILTQY